MEFDYVIVGSGAGGSVLAERLSAGSSATVLVVEAGGSDRHPVHLLPKSFFFTMQSPRYAKKFVAPSGTGGTDTWWRGRVVGGSTTINGLIWNRGWQPDYDRLEADGNPGWGWNTFLDAFKGLESFQFGGSDLHGARGRMDVEIAGPPDPVSEAFLESAQGIGARRVLDLNGSDDARAGYTQFSTRRGTRLTAARAFLRPALDRPHVTLLTRAEIGRILFDGTRAVGVLARHKGRQVEIRARREVIVCGGALDSPLLLERSGIGSADTLAAAGVPLLVESPNVGERLSEHRGLRYMATIAGETGFNHLVNTKPRQALTGAKYLLTRQGLIAQGSAAAMVYFRSSDAADRPDMLGAFNPISVKATTMHNSRMVVDDKPGLMMVAYALRPTSQGHIHVTGPDPGDPVAIDPRFYSTDYDRDVISHAGLRMRELFASGPISELITHERSPGADVRTEADFLQLAASGGSSVYHTLGTCAMGPDDDDVVDAGLRVRGTESLRVVDSSVFPYQPSGNTSAPTQALAWHAASLILQDSGDPVRG